MVSNINVVIFCQSNSEHVAQLYTGFGELEARGKIDVRWVFGRSHASPYQRPFLEIELNHHWHIMYDQSDTYLLPKVDLSHVDLLFKRSYRSAYLQTQPNGDKVLPTGLNYFVVSPHDRGLQRALSAVNSQPKIKLILKRLDWSARLGHMTNSVYDSQIEGFEAPPIDDAHPLILFATRLWKPERVGNSDLKAERNAINQTRIDIIRRLRREFGDQFVGGIMPEPYARELAPDLLLDPRLTQRKRYLESLRRASIGIATKGLLESVGWKFAEYIAASRAIVSEVSENPLYGNLCEGDNYLPFTTADECLAQVHRLVDDPVLRAQMMRNNQRYYQAYLRPDMLVMHTLLDALTYLDGPTHAKVG